MRPRALAVLIVLALAGCGGAPERPASQPPEAKAKVKAAPTVTLDQIERENAAARRAERRRRAAAQPSPSPTATPRAVPRPPITQARIPFPASRRRETAAYAQRHYGTRSARLVQPKVIVEHYTVTATAAEAIALFTADTADAELHELPNTCAHFVVDTDGTIDQLVPLGLMCRHTVGLNDVAIGIEHAGFNAREILSRPAQMKASLALTRWLQCRYGIASADVIGHNESLSSPYHHEQVAALRTQTHDDWTAAEMRVYRRRLARAGGC